MRRTLLWLAIAGCGTPAARRPPEGTLTVQPAVPRLTAPPLIDAGTRGAAYLTAVALSLQPAWHQFLEDCRLRLPAHHALNELSLVALAELELDERGRVVDVRVATSGNADFDRATRQVIEDASPLPPPPRELWSDDDHVHLAWTFARDRGQAGPATAQIVDVVLPVRGVVDRLIGERDLSRAARRILREKRGADREAAARRLMIELLREASSVSDGDVRRAAVEAIARARVTELAAAVRELLTDTSDVELRLAAIDAVAVLHDDAAAPLLADQLADALRERPRLAIAEARALGALGRVAEVEAVLAEALRDRAPEPVALQLLAIAPGAAEADALGEWLRSRQMRQRAAVCAALAGYPGEVAWPLLARGLGDRDATVRASCADAAKELATRPGARAMPRQRTALAARRTVVAKLCDLARDRDNTVRARAIAALAALDPELVPEAAAADRAADVRVAYARALGTLLGHEDTSARGADSVRELSAQLRGLADDRDPDVRAAAWGALAALPRDPELRALATHAAADPAAQVRRAAVLAVDEELLLRLAQRDDAGEVRTAALVELCGRRGRAASADLLLSRIAEAAPGSAERVRAALAWLLAR